YHASAGKASALDRQFAQQRRRLEHLFAGLSAPVVEPLVDLRDAFEASPEHRPAPANGEAVAVDPDDVDIRRAGGNALLEYACTLVHQRVERTFEDFLVGDFAALDILRPRRLLDQPRHLRIGLRRTRTFRIAVEAAAGLLAEVALVSERIGDQRALAERLALAPADVEARHVHHRERSHREAEVGEHAVDL